jgi:hypothetical protein
MTTWPYCKEIPHGSGVSPSMYRIILDGPLKYALLGVASRVATVSPAGPAPTLLDMSDLQ